jgi:hypothetical protein
MDTQIRKRVDKIKLHAFQNARVNKSDLRFEGPEVRKHSWRLVVLNADVVDLSKFVRDVYPCSVFLRAARDTVDTSRLDVYIPVRTGMTWWLTAMGCWAASATCMFACAYTLGNRR